MKNLTIQLQLTEEQLQAFRKSYLFKRSQIFLINDVDMHPIVEQILSQIDSHTKESEIS